MTEQTQETTQEPVAQTESIAIEHEKVRALIEEFGLKDPSQTTFSEAKALIRNGLPFVKGMGSDQMLPLLNTGILTPSKNPELNDILYASCVKSKSYGGFAVVLDSKVMQSNQFQAACVDNGSPYVYHQIPKDPTDPLKEHRKEERNKIMQKYTLTPDEFYEFFSFCLASFTDEDPMDYVNSDEWEHRIEAINFDIYLPNIRREAIKKIFLKKGWSDDEEAKPDVEELTKQHGIPFETIPFKHEKRPEEAITEIIEDEYQIPAKFRDAFQAIA